MKVVRHCIKQQWGVLWTDHESSQYSIVLNSSGVFYELIMKVVSTSLY